MNSGNRSILYARKFIARIPNNMNHKISSFESTHSGERLFIVGNGPSLQQTPLSSIQNEYSMGMNKIHEIYTQTDWRPSFYINPWEPSYFSERNERCSKDIINVNKRQDILFIIKFIKVTLGSSYIHCTTSDFNIRPSLFIKWI